MRYRDSVMYKFPELVGDSGVQVPFCGASGRAGAVAEAGHDGERGSATPPTSLHPEQLHFCFLYRRVHLLNESICLK